MLRIVKNCLLRRMSLKTTLVLSKNFLKEMLFTIHQRHIQSLATELFKDKGNLSSNIMYDIFQTGKINYSLRLQTNFASNCVNTNKFGLNLPGYFASKVWKKFSLENKNP